MISMTARRSLPCWTQIDDPIASFTGDGAYDQDGVYGEVAARHPMPRSSCHRDRTRLPSPTAETEPTPRDRHLQVIAEHGRMGWQKASGYNWRAWRKPILAAGNG
jgi:hypothetical protein